MKLISCQNSGDDTVRKGWKWEWTLWSTTNKDTSIWKKKDNVESVAEAFENLLNSVDLEDIEGICCIFSGLCVTLDIQEDLLKAEIYGKKNER